VGNTADMKKQISPKQKDKLGKYNSSGYFFKVS